MLEAFVTNSDSNVVAIVSSERDLRLPRQASDRVRFVVMPRLIYGLPVGRIRARWELCRLLMGAKTFSIVGADVMDGGYRRRESVIRSHLLRLAQTFNVPTQVLGFSWSASPDAVAASELARASHEARCLLRDGRSLERARASGIVSSELVADMVFSLEGVEPVEPTERWLRAERDAGRTVVALNTSGLISARMDVDRDYDELARYLLDRGCSVVVLPHVVREGDDDSLPAARLAASLASRHVHVVDGVWLPANVAWLAQQCACVITGRMHFAILAATQGTPAITLATQGKVEGMLSFFGLQDLAIEPRPGMSADLIRVAGEVLSDPEARRDQILTAMPEVVALSQKNFELVR